MLRPSRTRATRPAALLVATTLAAAALAGCSEKPSMEPIAVHMREIGRVWALFLETYQEKGGYHAQPYVTQLTGMFQAEVMTNSEKYPSEDFKKKNADMIQSLERLDSDLGQRMPAEMARSDVQQQCKWCHTQYWEKSKKLRERRG